MVSRDDSVEESQSCRSRGFDAVVVLGSGGCCSCVGVVVLVVVVVVVVVGVGGSVCASHSTGFCFFFADIGAEGVGEVVGAGTLSGAGSSSFAGVVVGVAVGDCRKYSAVVAWFFR